MIEKLLINLIYVIPILLISGPFLPDLLVVIIGLYVLYIFYKREFIKISRNLKLVTLFFLTFYIFILVRSTISVDPLLSYQSSLYYFRFILFALGIIHFFYKDNNLLKKISFVSLLSILVLSTDSIFEAIFGFRLFGSISPGSEYGRLSSFFGDELIMGSFLIKTMPFALMLINFNYNTINNKSLYFISFIVLMLAYSGIYLSGERSAMFSGMILLMVLIFSIPNVNFYRKIIFSSCLISLIVFAIFSFDDSSSKRFRMAVDQIFSKNQNINIFSPQHESHIKTALLMYKDNMIFGHGSKIFRKLCSDEKYLYVVDKNYEVKRITDVDINDIEDYGCSTHPHHFYVQILSENGLIGLFFFLSFVGYLIFKTIFCFKNNYHLVNNKNFPIFILSISLLLIFNPFLPSINIFNNWISCFIYLKFGLLLSLNEKINTKG